jgi:hypothetical protein
MQHHNLPISSFWLILICLVIGGNGSRCPCLLAQTLLGRALFTGTKGTIVTCEFALARLVWPRLRGLQEQQRRIVQAALLSKPILYTLVDGLRHTAGGGQSTRNAVNTQF